MDEGVNVFYNNFIENKERKVCDSSNKIPIQFNILTKYEFYN